MAPEKCSPGADLDKSKDRHISYAEFRSWIKNGMGTRHLADGVCYGEFQGKNRRVVHSPRNWGSRGLAKMMVFS